MKLIIIAIFIAQVYNQKIPDFNCTHQFKCEKDEKDFLKITSDFKCLCNHTENEDVCSDFELILAIKHSNISIECSHEFKLKRKELSGYSLVFVLVNEIEKINSFNCSMSLNRLDSNKTILGYNFNDTKINPKFCDFPDEESYFKFLTYVAILTMVILLILLFISLCIYYKCKRMKRLRTRPNENVIFIEHNENEYEAVKNKNLNPVLLSTMSKNRVKIPMIQSLSCSITDQSNSFESSSIFEPTPESSQLSEF